MKFTKKPVTIDAVQWFKDGDHPQVRAIAETDDLYFTGMGGAALVNRAQYGVIGTLESPAHLVIPGDWIITGVKGEHYPCKPDIFALTYEAAAITDRAGEPVPVALIDAGALRQFKHNDGSEGFVFAYDKVTTDRVLARLQEKIEQGKEAYENMKAWAEENGVDTVTYGLKG